MLKSTFAARVGTMLVGLVFLTSSLQAEALVPGELAPASITRLDGAYDLSFFHVDVGSLLITSGLTIHAERILVEGAIVGLDGTQYHPDGASIVLEATSLLVVRGMVKAGSGWSADTALVEGWENELEGLDGGHGGSVVVRVSVPEGQLELSSTAQVMSGSGGNGQTVIATPSKTSALPLDKLKASGGAGGHGGIILISGETADFGLTATVRSARGGAGGTVLLVGAAGSAIGGAGGDAGVAFVNGASTVEFLAQNADAFGGRGGGAVSAANQLAIPSPLKVSLLASAPDLACSLGVPIYGCPGTEDVKGCDATDNTATGGPGGFGILEGGPGGDADSTGCNNNGKGDDGAAGKDGGFDTYQYPCPEGVCHGVTYRFPTDGEDGKEGPSGGSALAYGGKGGLGVVKGGKGGGAKANGGKGGIGGNGGKGGSVVVGLCVDGADGGSGGTGGAGGPATAQGGRGGDALVGVGGQGTLGSAEGGVGGAGGAGGPGGSGGQDLDWSIPKVGGLGGSICKAENGEAGPAGATGATPDPVESSGGNGNDGCLLQGKCRDTDIVMRRPGDQRLIATPCDADCDDSHVVVRCNSDCFETDIVVRWPGDGTLIATPERFIKSEG